MRLKQSTASQVVMFRAFLSSDHVSNATGKTIVIKISKNGAAFNDPNAGATNATEISAGWYKVTLDATDTATEGPLAVKGTEAAIDDVGLLCWVESVASTGPSAADIADAVWDEATSGHTTAGTFGKSDADVLAAVVTEVADIKAKTDQLTFTTANKLDATIQAAGDFAQGAADKVWSTVARTLTAATNLTGPIADQVWDEALAGHLTAGSTGEALDAGGGSGASTPADVAQAVWAIDMSTVTSPADRSPLNAVRILRNKVNVAAGTMSVYEEDDTTLAWESTVTTTVGALPITESDPS